MRSNAPIPGNPWPHDMIITVEDRPNVLLELLWIREAFALQPHGEDLPPLLLENSRIRSECCIECGYTRRLGGRLAPNLACGPGARWSGYFFTTVRGDSNHSNRFDRTRRTSPPNYRAHLARRVWRRCVRPQLLQHLGTSWHGCPFSSVVDATRRPPRATRSIDTGLRVACGPDKDRDDPVFG